MEITNPWTHQKGELLCIYLNDWREKKIHKSYSIALDKITLVERNKIHIDQTIILVGDTWRENFQRMLKR